MSCNIFTPAGLEELTARCRRAAHMVKRGDHDYDDVVQDMLAWIVEAQAKDPDYCHHHPSYQVKYAMRRAQDKRRSDRGQDVMRRCLLVPIDTIEPPSSPSAEMAYMRIEKTHQVVTALDTLTDGEKTVILRRFYFEQTCSEVAEDLGITKGTVCSQSHRAFHRMARHIAL